MAASESRDGQRRAGWTVSAQAAGALEAGTGAGLQTVGVLIPVWQPSSDLPDLVRDLLACGFGSLVIVDDGSDRKHEPLFDELRAMPSVTVVQHTLHRGKGRALKTGLLFFKENVTNLVGVVTADADGQHLPKDIERVGSALLSDGERCVLGSRTFDRKAPLTNGLGNRITAHVFRFLTRCKIRDTQTGLRGFPRSLWADLLAVPGERYEYETAVLVELCRSGRAPLEVPIETVYLNGNRSSHFRPLHDSVHIYWTLLRTVFRAGPGPRRR